MNENHIQLKPCPFCGSKNLSITTHHGHSGWVKVKCENCRMNFEYEEDYIEKIVTDSTHPNIKYHTGYFENTKPTFVEAWNRRDDENR